MKLKGNTILITGGSNGIGYALAERFLAAGNEVIICGRREDRLNSAKKNHPKLHIYKCDVENEDERTDLFNKMQRDFPKLNVLINNAGIQQRQSLKQPYWDDVKHMIRINLDAPVHFCSMFTPALMERKDSCIINVSSGLGFIPQSGIAVYSAVKSALHSFTFSLREQLQDAGVEVIEIIPPPVKTDLGGIGVHIGGAEVDEFVDGVWSGLEKGRAEIGFWLTEFMTEANPKQVWLGRKTRT